MCLNTVRVIHTVSLLALVSLSMRFYKLNYIRSIRKTTQKSCGARIALLPCRAGRRCDRRTVSSTLEDCEIQRTESGEEQGGCEDFWEVLRYYVEVWKC